MRCCADSVVCRMAMPNIDWSDISTNNMSTIDVRDFVTGGHVWAMILYSGITMSGLGALRDDTLSIDHACRRRRATVHKYFDMATCPQ